MFLYFIQFPHLPLSFYIHSSGVKMLLSYEMKDDICLTIWWYEWSQLYELVFHSTPLLSVNCTIWEIYLDLHCSWVRHWTMNRLSWQLSRNIIVDSKTPDSFMSGTESDLEPCNASCCTVEEGVPSCGCCSPRSLNLLDEFLKISTHKFDPNTSIDVKNMTSSNVFVNQFWLKKLYLFK
jgi:hypothetical protein